MKTISPNESIKLYKKRNKWEKWIEKYIKKYGWDYFYKKIKELNDYEYNRKKSYIKGLNISTIMFNRSNHRQNYYLITSHLVNENFLEVLDIYDFVHFMCLKYDLNFPAFLNGWIQGEVLGFENLFDLLGLFDKSFSDIIDKEHIPIPYIEKYEAIENNKIKIIPVKRKYVIENENKVLSPKTLNEIIDIVTHNFLAIIDGYEHILKNPLNYPPEVLAKLMEFTINKAEKEKIKLHFHSNDLRIDERKREINNTLYLLKEKLKDKRAIKYALNNDSHYLNLVFQDEIIIDIQSDKPNMYFRGFYNGLKYGLYEKGLYFGSYRYKRELIRELQNTKKYISNFSFKFNQKQIKILDELIEFLKQDKRVADYIPYKELVKLFYPKSQDNF